MNLTQKSSQYLLPMFNRMQYDVDNFIVSSSNNLAYERIKNWPIGFGIAPYEFAMLLYGPTSSGKTYLATIWQTLSNAFFIKKDTKILSVELIKEYNSFIIEDIEDWDEQNLLHSFNIINEYRKYLLMTTSLITNNFAIKDLSSRINAIMKLQVNQPDDELMRQLVFKYFSDQSINVSEKVVNYLLINLPRQFDEMIKILSAISDFSLIHKVPIKVSLIKSLLF